VSQCALLQAKKRPGDGEETLESSEQNYVEVSKYSPPDISKYTSHEMEELLLSKVRPFQAQKHVDPPDPHVFGPLGSGSIIQRYGTGSRSGSFYLEAKLVRKTLSPTV
jgi:hypothetical protein